MQQRAKTQTILPLDENDDDGFVLSAACPAPTHESRFHMNLSCKHSKQRSELKICDTNHKIIISVCVSQ